MKKLFSFSIIHTWQAFDEETAAISSKKLNGSTNYLGICFCLNVMHNLLTPSHF